MVSGKKAYIHTYLNTRYNDFGKPKKGDNTKQMPITCFRSSWTARWNFFRFQQPKL